MDYLLKASALLTIFYGCYILLLQRETFFSANRWFLVLGLLTSVLLPLLVIPIYVQLPSTSNIDFKLAAATIQDTPETLDLTPIFMWIYATITTFLVGRLIIQLFSLLTLIKKHDNNKNGSYSFIETQQNTAPFSFFKWIVYNPEHFNKQELQLILNHEKVHAKQMHSVDVLLTDLISAIFWFNPFIWLYRKALKQNLEFIADYNTQKATDCGVRYQKLLLKTSLPQQNLIIINTFYNSSIKKRIVMLHKSKSNLMNTWKYSIIVPVLVVFAMTFNTKTLAQTSDPISESTSGDQQNILKFVVTKDTKAKQLDFIKNKLADNDASITFNDVKRNSKNEIIGIKILFENKKTAGNIFANSSAPISPIEISFNPSNNTINLGQQSSGLGQTFDVDTTNDGQIKINKINSKNSVSIIHDDEVEVIYEQPGNLLSNHKGVPLIIINGKETTKEQMEAIDPDHIGFVTVLKEENATKKYGDKGKDGVILITTKKENELTTDKAPPLYILDGKEITKEEMSAIDVNTVDAVNVLKDEKATKKYGEKGKNGVILITLKK